MHQSASYSQEHRLIAVDTPLGKDVLLLQELTGHEGISRLFSFDLDLLAFENDSISFEDIVGQKVSITLRLPDGTSALYQRVYKPIHARRNRRTLLHPLQRPGGAVALVPDPAGGLPNFPESRRARHHQPGFQSLRLQGFPPQPPEHVSARLNIACNIAKPRSTSSHA